MRERFTNRQIVMLVVAICAAIVAAPIGVMAATGELVNITDPEKAAYRAQVTSGGRLTVASQSADVTNRLFLGRMCGDLPSQGSPYINVAAYREVRLYITGITGGGTNTMYVNESEEGHYTNLFDTISVPNGGYLTRLYTVPGRRISIYCQLGNPSQVQVSVFGRR